MYKYFIFLLVLLLAIIVSIPAENNSETESSPVFALVLYADGFEFAVARDGRYTIYDAVLDDIVGLPLLAGDLIQTDDDTFLEIQLLPSENILKVAENTTFQIRGLGGSGGGVFELTYGKVRAKVQKLSGTDPFQIHGSNAVAGVRGTDFGYDFVAQRGLSTAGVTQIYCFEGEVEVKEAISIESPVEKEALVISANEMVTVEPLVTETDMTDALPGETVSFKKLEITEEISEYWNQNAFEARPLDAAEVEELLTQADEVFSGKRILRFKMEPTTLKEEPEDEGVTLQTAPPEEVAAVEEETVPEETVEETEEPLPQVELGYQEPDPVKEVSQQQKVFRIAGISLFTLGALVETGGIYLNYNNTGSYIPQLARDNLVSSALVVGGGIISVSGIISFIVSYLVE
jgi:hypothetical protein